MNVFLEIRTKSLMVGGLDGRCGGGVENGSFMLSRQSVESPTWLQLQFLMMINQLKPHISRHKAIYSRL